MAEAVESAPRVPVDRTALRWPQVVILGAGRPARGVDPSALVPAAAQGAVLDWQLSALRTQCAQVLFVGGYRIEQVVRRYPDLPVLLNPEWARGGPAGSLLCALPKLASDSLVCYADVLLRPELLQAMAGRREDVVLAVDLGWRARYDARASSDLAQAEVVWLDTAGVPKRMGAARELAKAPEEALPGGSEHATLGLQGEFAGVAALSGRALHALSALAERPDVGRWSLPALLQCLLDQGLSVSAVDATQQWAELNAAQDVARFVLGTKAETLERLRPLVGRSVVGHQVRCTVARWHAQRQLVLDEVTRNLGTGRLIVRSSALAEDGFSRSNAGRFVSVTDVDGADPQAVAAAFEQVVASYGKALPEDQVLAQCMVPRIALAGVAMTRTLSHGAPYLVLNFEAGSGRADLVTSGAAARQQLVYLHHAAAGLPEGAPAALAAVREALIEVQSLVCHDALDVEFIVDQDGVVHLLQARPIAVDHAGWRGSDAQVEAVLRSAEEAFVQLQPGAPRQLGASPLYSRMTDWNPAEMIGSRPKALACTLYEELITREVWATQRAQYGYRDPGFQPLMHQFAGQAYVDVRASLNSFVPASVDEELAARVVEWGLERLRGEPALHDKVEFSVAFTCFDLGFDERAQSLSRSGFTDEQLARLRRALIDLTQRGMARAPDDLALALRLQPLHQALTRSRAPALRRACTFIAAARQHGTPVFAHLARAGFVAASLLRSALAQGAVDEEAHAGYLASVPTVATALVHDLQAFHGGRLDQTDFLARYGHLRPGTYDLTVPCYAQAPGLYLRVESPAPAAVASPWPSAGSPSRHRDAGVVPGLLAAALTRQGLVVGPQELDAFLRSAIAGRELAKFEFTRFVCSALEALAEWGEGCGLRRDDLANLSWYDLRSAADGLLGPDLGPLLLQRAEEGRLRHEVALGIELPDLLTSVADLRAFVQQPGRANFIGHACVVAPVVCVDGADLSDLPLQGAIILVRQADPGHDWLFGQEIAGLVTAFGGANSHMAVRAAEFGLPAAIGVGERQYDWLARCRRAVLDAGQRQIREAP